MCVRVDCFWVLETDDASGDKFVLITLTKAMMGYESWAALLEEDQPDTTVTHRVRAPPTPRKCMLARVAMQTQSFIGFFTKATALPDLPPASLFM